VEGGSVSASWYARSAYPLHRARLAAAVVACVLALTIVTPVPAGAAASHGVDGVNVYMSRGFVHASAWFKDTGPGQSWVHTWIDTYSATTGQLMGSLGHRSGVSSCRSGSTCYVLLMTSVQAKAGECYVARALSGRGSDLVEARAPASHLFCL
jgi:hypothetical protein